MIVKRKWTKTFRVGHGGYRRREIQRVGWFLFGVLPLYICDLSVKEYI
jgi:hypothetical protein